MTISYSDDDRDLRRWLTDERAYREYCRDHDERERVMHGVRPDDDCDEALSLFSGCSLEQGTVRSGSESSPQLPRSAAK